MLFCFEQVSYYFFISIQIKLHKFQLCPEAVSQFEAHMVIKWFERKWRGKKMTLKTVKTNEIQLDWLERITSEIKGWVLSFLPLFYLSIPTAVFYTRSCNEAQPVTICSHSLSLGSPSMPPQSKVLRMKCTCVDPNTRTLMEGCFMRRTAQTQHTELASSSFKFTWRTWLWFSESWGTKLKISRLICVWNFSTTNWSSL